MRFTSFRGPFWILAIVLGLGGCAAKTAKPEMPLSPLSKLCNDSAVTDKSFCLPKKADVMLRTGKFNIAEVRKPTSGLGGALIFFLKYPGEQFVIKAKWKGSKKGGEGFNNQPRKELAGYKFQSLFLEPEEFVVPPTAGRCIPTASIREKVPDAIETFEGVPCVFGILAYWLPNVNYDQFFDVSRFNSDSAYRQNLANMNLLTYLIDHRDTRPSNFLVSSDKAHPRIFSIDNGLAFSGFRNPLAFFTKTNWANIIVPALPKAQIERLRKITRQDLDTLLTVAQYSVTPRGLEEVPPTAALSDSIGVRREGDVIQFGLTRKEVDAVDARLKALLERVDRGKIQVF